MDKKNNAVTANGKLLEFTQEQAGRVVDAKISSGCKFLAWKTHTIVNTSGDGYGDTYIQIYVTPFDGPFPKSVASVYIYMATGTTPPLDVSNDVMLAHFEDEYLVLIIGGGDFSSGQGYYPVAGRTAVILETAAFTQQVMGLLDLSADGRWLLGSGNRLGGGSTLFLKDLTTGRLAFVQPVGPPPRYQYYFSPDTRFLIYGELSGKEISGAYDYEGASSIMVRKRDGDTWSEPIVLVRKESGAPYHLMEWMDSTHIKILGVTKTGETADYSLNVITGALQALPSK